MKKVLSVVLSIAMVVCLMPSMAFAATVNTAASASYSDTEGKACEGAVNVLTALGVVDGYEDGTYKPEQTVTRAEMAKLVITALGVSDYASATTSRYTDMTNAGWAIPFVEYASNLNIINGYGNGMFGPNDTVTYEQAATMIVRALGYTDECNEMNGTWPAIYIQKAMALGIFEDVENGGPTGANRGDVAIMLYNAIDLPEVYADKDGATLYKHGNEQFTINGQPVSGVSMLATLNKDGKSEYKILKAPDADSAIIDVRSYVGAAGKIYTNKDGDVISVGDLKSEFLTGTVNGDGDTFTTTDGTKYTINDDAFSTFKDGSNDGSIDKGKEHIVKFINGEEEGNYSTTKNGPLDEVAQNKQITIAAKTSGRTITSIFSVLEWKKSEGNSSTIKAGGEQFLFEESDADTISNKQSLHGYDFLTNDDGEVDYSSFILTGVDSLDNIEEDNVVYVYYGKSENIRKVEVGTETVEGTFESFSSGTVSTTDNMGKDATYTINGTDYRGTNKSDIDESDNAKDYYIQWLLGKDDSDDVGIGDEVKAYLDASGKIYQLEQTEAGSSAYALVLDYYIAYDNNDYSITSKNKGLNGDDNLIKVLTAEGDAITLTLKDEAKIKTDIKKSTDKDANCDIAASSNGDTVALSVGDIITYNLNSSNRVKDITIKADAIIGNGNLQSAIDEADISKKGYYNGTAINESAVIFSVDKPDKSNNNLTDGGNRKGVSDGWAPQYYIDEDDASVSTGKSLFGTDDVTGFAQVTKSSKYNALVINGDAVSNDLYYGVTTGVTTVDSDNYNGDYRVTMLVGDEEKSYIVDDDVTITPVKNRFYAFKVNAAGDISDLYSVDKSGPTIIGNDTANTYLGYISAFDSGVKVSSNVAKPAENEDNNVKNGSVTLDSSIVYLDWSSSNSTFEVASKSDMTTASDRVVLYFDTDKDDDKDGVADLAIIAPVEQADILLNIDGYFENIEDQKTKGELDAEVKAARDNLNKAKEAGFNVVESPETDDANKVPVGGLTLIKEYEGCKVEWTTEDPQTIEIKTDKFNAEAKQVGTATLTANLSKEDGNVKSDTLTVEFVVTVE